MPRSRALLRLYYFVFFSALGVYNPFFPTWLTAHGIQGLRMSTITVLNPLLGIVGPVLFGVTADALGLRGSLLRLAAFGAAAPFVVLAALLLGGHSPSYVTLLGLVFVFAFFRGPLVSMADVTALEAPGSYGRTRLFGSAGFLITAIVAGFLLDGAAAWVLPFAIAACLLVTTLVAGRLPARVVKPTEPVTEEALRLLRSTDYLVFLAGVVLWYAAHVSYDLCFSLHLRDLGASSRMVGLFWALGVVAEVGLMANAHRLFARYSESRLLAFGVGSSAVRFALIAVVKPLGVLFLLQPLHALSFALTWTASLEFIRKRAPARVRATAQSFFSVATCLGSALGMLTWGPRYAASGGAQVFAGAAVVATLGTLAALGLGAVTRPETAPSSESAAE